MQLNNKLKCGNQLPVPVNYVKHVRCLFQNLFYTGPYLGQIASGK